MIITCSTILWTTLVVVSAQAQSSEQSSNEQPKALIQNKNVNINVIVNSKELAQELWKIIESRLNNRSKHMSNSKSITKDLQEAVIPLLQNSNSRRSIFPSAFQVATQLDKITRRAIIRDTPAIDMLDEEIMTRDIVTDMMAFLKIILSKQIELKTDKDSPKRRTIYHPTLSDDDEQNYVNVRIKIHKKDILDAIH